MKKSLPPYAPWIEDPDPEPPELTPEQESARAKKAGELLDRKRAEAGRPRPGTPSANTTETLMAELRKAYPKATETDLREHLRLFG